MTDSDRKGGARYGILFVCLGNICRSPLAEGIFRHRIRAEGLEESLRVDSAGTGGWHEGERADPRARAVAEKHGVELESRARKIRTSDFTDFDLILAMDEDNLAMLKIAGREVEETAELRLLRFFDPDGGPQAEVPDPYYGANDGFDRVFEMIDRSCEHLLESIRDEIA